MLETIYMKFGTCTLAKDRREDHRVKGVFFNAATSCILAACNATDIRERTLRMITYLLLSIAIPTIIMSKVIRYKSLITEMS